MSIPTNYKGVEYRSRLEARWAAFFDVIGWHHTYEPFDGHGYIPDFLIHGDRPLLVEVKPASTYAEYGAPIPKIEIGLADRPEDVLILGVDPLPRFENSWANQFPPAGLLGERGGFHNDESPRSYEVADWMTCRECNEYGVFHDMGLWAGRPCGHYDGDHFLVDPGVIGIKGAWATATNVVKWRGRDAS